MTTDGFSMKEVVIEIKFGNRVIAEHILSVSSLKYIPVTGKSDFTLQFTDIKEPELKQIKKRNKPNNNS